MADKIQSPISALSCGQEALSSRIASFDDRIVAEYRKILALCTIDSKVDLPEKVVSDLYASDNELRGYGFLNYCTGKVTVVAYDIANLAAVLAFTDNDIQRAFSNRYDAKRCAFFMKRAVQSLHALREIQIPEEIVSSIRETVRAGINTTSSLAAVTYLRYISGQYSIPPLE